VRLDEAKRNTGLDRERLQGRELLEDQVPDGLRRHFEFPTAEMRAIGIAGMGADHDPTLSGIAQRPSDSLEATGMGAAAYARRAHLLEEGSVVGTIFTQVGVEVDGGALSETAPLLRGVH